MEKQTSNFSSSIDGTNLNVNEIKKRLEQCFINAIILS